MARRIDVKRWLVRLLLTGVVLFVVLHVINLIRIDALQLRSSVAQVVERAETMGREAIPEYQDLALARLARSPVNGEFYRFDDNLETAESNAIGAPDSETRGGGGEFVVQFEFEGSDETSLVAAKGNAAVDRRDGLLLVTHRDEDYLVNERPLRIPLSAISDIIVRARATAGNRFRVLWAAEGRESTLEDNALSLDLIADGEFHTYIVNARDAFRRGVQADEMISTLGIEPSNSEGAVVEIDYVRIVSRSWKYQAQRTGTSYESVDGELRPVLFTVANQRLEFVVDVPRQTPKLRFGTAALFGDRPVDASISVIKDEESEQVFAISRPSSDAWQDEEIDLAPWAGESVHVVFESRGPGEDVLFWSNPIVESAPERRFNVIVILEDALRGDHLSTQGYSRETSPEKTKLMNERGIIFSHAHSQATKTRPSVAALMTSLYPTATGVWTFSDRLSDRYLTLAEIMRAQGYVTASFIQNGNAGPYAGAHQGFGSLREVNTIGEAAEDIFGERILAWLEKNGERNFFLYLHAIDPHGIYDPPPPYDHWYREAPAEDMVGEKRLRNSESIDPEWAETPSGEARRRLYDGEILHNDAVIGRFIQQLEKGGFLDDTLLMFVSDHGEWLGELGNWEHRPPGNQPVIHVPLMVVYPKFAAPQRIEESVQLIDVMPTILELAEIDTSEFMMHGDSLVSLMQGSDAEHWASRVTVSEEPMAMDRADPCACGSLFFDEWQLHGSVRSRPGRLKSEFVKSAVYRFREDGIMPVWSFLPDVYMRFLRTRSLSRIQSANIDLWHKITAGEQGDVYEMDPATLEELRGLGYVN